MTLVHGGATLNRLATREPGGGALKLDIAIAREDEKKVIQNLARFYIYDLSSYQQRRCPDDGLFADEDYGRYWAASGHTPLLVRCDDELAGFALVAAGGRLPDTDYHIAEFFVLRKFRRRGVGSAVAREIFATHPGRWEVMVIADNLPALKFWERCVDATAKGQVAKTAESHGVEMRVFRFSSEPMETPEATHP